MMKLVLLPGEMLICQLLNLYPTSFHIAYNLPVEDPCKRKRGDTKDHPLTRWFMNFSEADELLQLAAARQQVASFPFDDHNCPPIHLISLFCRSAYSWLKEDIENVVVVHCKAGMARTGLMISSLLLYLKFFPTAEESIDYYNQKRCFDGKELVLPSQIRYVKYFERILTYFNGENPPGRRCMLRGFRLHRCPYWVRPTITVSDHNGVLFSTKDHPRTKSLSPEDFWFSAPKNGLCSARGTSQ